MRYLSLFTRIGGFEIGIQQAYEISNMGRTTSTPDTEDRRHLPLSNNSDGNGWRTDTSIPECIGFSEIDKYAIQIYKRHFPTHKNYGYIPKEILNQDTFTVGIKTVEGWTKVDISDTQRYKCCGNAVTTNVIRDIMMKLL